MKRKGEARNVLLCAVLTAQLILLPVLGANVRAAGVTPDPNAAANKRPSMETAPNGVPVVNITAANGSGLSHNQYHDFNVHQQGLILNNSSGAANSQLGGIVAGNPNFHGNRGAEARTILNEVTSANRSRIEGYIEVNGRAADVILANPNGVTVNGGGFINVPRATITTGKPEVDPGGALRGYEVRQGDIRIEGAGINADNTDAFTLLARTAHVEAQVRASSLAVVTGKNSVAADGTVTPLADPSPAPADPGNPAAEEKPEVGIDSSALGGMYANRITLIATEKGVGVNLEGTVQSADQMVITADGKLRLREAVSGGDAVLAGKGDIELTGAAVTAARDLTVTADNLRLEKGVFEPQYEARKAKKQAGSVTAGAEAAPASGLTDPTPEPEPEKSSLLYAGGDMLLTTARELLNEQSEIRAEGSLRIADADGQGNNSVRNSSGTMAAGKDLSISAKTLENTRSILNIRRDASSWHVRSWDDNFRWGDRKEKWWDYHELNAAQDSLIEATMASVISADGNISIAVDSFLNSASHVAAGKNLDIFAATSLRNQSYALYKSEYEHVSYCHDDEDGDLDHYHDPQTFVRREVLTPYSASLTAGDTLTITGAALQNLADVSYAAPLTNKDPASLEEAVTVLSDSALFHTVSGPGHHYLIETNPMLTNMGLFYGSDYFLSRIGLDQDRQQVVLLGDAFYETRLVQQQIMDATGQRFLSGYSSDADQMRGLMDNAVAQASELKLAAGVALTSTQVAALTDDIVWLVEQEVNGQKVMVPQVYLASNSKNAVITGGSLVAANNVSITAGAATNSGSTIRGNNLSMLADNINNAGGGVLTGGAVQLAAAQDIRNSGSTISGNNVTLAAGRDIVSEARIVGGNGVTRLGETGGIAAADGLQMLAGRDVTLAGSRLAAGGDARVSAGRDVNVTTVTTGSSFHGYHLDEDITTHHGSSVVVGGNLQMTAGNDLTVAGSGVAAGGDATLAAGRNLSVTAVQDVFKQEIRGSSSNGLLGSSSSRRNEERVTSKAATVTAGGNLNLLAGASISGAPAQTGHASVVGSNLASVKDLTVAASGNVNVASAQDTYFYSYSKSSTGALGLSSSSKKEGKATVTQVESNLIGRNVTLDAGKSVSVTASNLAAVDNINLTARDGDVAVVDGKNQSTSWYYKKQTGFGLGGGGSFTSFYGTEGKKEQSAGSTSKGSALAAGQDITLTASRDAAIVGSSLNAGNNVTINAGRDANILGGANTSSHSKEKFASGFGVEGILGLDKTSFFMGYQETAKGNAKANTQNAASQITANNNITVNAGQNVNMSGSRLAAAQDLNMAAGKDINLLQATDTASASDYEKTLRAGLSLTLEQNLTSNAQQVYQNAKTAVEANGLLDSAQSGFKAVNGVGQTLTNSSASASLTLGVNASQSSSESHATTAVPTELAAGQDMNLTAGQDLTMQGTQAQAGKDMTLVAGRDLNIHAAVSTADSDSQNSSWGASVGLKATVSKNGPAFGLSADGQLGMGWSDNEGTFYHNAKVTAGEKLTTVSGQDTTVAGGNLTGKDVDMTVGRNLTVASKQDTGEGSSGQFTVSAGATVGYGADLELPGLSNAADAAKSITPKAGLTVGNGSAEKRWVTEQSSILGTDSVTIRTEKNTHVAGAIIAALNDNLKLDTGTLSYENLHGVDNSSNTSWGVNFEKRIGLDEGKKKQDEYISDRDSIPTSQNGDAYSKTIIPHFTWIDGILKGQDKLQSGWNNAKKIVMFSPGAYSHQSTEKKQTAYATIGKGEIIVRDNLSMSLEGLNRDQNKATSESQSVTNINYKAAFSYVDEVIGMQGIPYALKDANEMWEDPKGFWGNQWIEVKKSFNGLTDSFAQLWGSLSGKEKQPEQPNSTPPVGNNPQP
ncbi:hemagglutinin repeat-containing protein [uncultured Desulfovibrio sp.]|uniref:hemagglutinin repeat-containing protein n=1 Tax=uncultured Desulfovibrio sp. TaxID=167968 RepID=UPI0026DCEC56|nr:hemagglutinin repeat-containing protein [uncultured Desulfovibrio sp.]